MKDLLINAFILPFQAYFTPRTFLAKVNQAVPEQYTLARAFYSSPDIRRRATQFIIQVGVSTIVIPLLTAIIAWFLIPNANLLYMLGGALASLFLGIAFGILPNLLFYFKGGMAAAIAFGVIFGSVFAVLLGIYSSLGGSIDPSAIGAAVDSPTGLATNAVLLGLVLGISIRIFVANMAKDVRQAMLVGLIIIVPLAILMGLFSQPHVLITNRIAGIFIILAFTGWFALPVQVLISLVNRLLVASTPQLAPRLWRIAPVAWDDFLIIPMPDSVPLLRTLYDVDREVYRKAFNRVKQHPFQSRYATIAQQHIVSQ